MNEPRPTIMVLATLDTKLEESSFVADEIRAAGGEPLLLDLSLDPTTRQASPSGVSSEQIVAKLGLDSERSGELTKSDLMSAVAAGAFRAIEEGVGSGKVHGILGLGGGTGTWLVARAISGLELGLPKVLVSTVAGPIAAELTAGSDIVVVPAVTDIAGLNSVLRGVLARAAVAVVAMANRNRATPPTDRAGSRGALALSTFGVTTRGATFARRHLEAEGYEVIAFHATGQGGRTLERLTNEGAFVGVIDFTTSELIDEAVGGRCSAGPERLEAAGRRGIPQVVVPGAIDVINIGHPASVPQRFADRISHLHREDSLLIRTSAAESRAVGATIGRKLQATRGPASVMVPLGGFSSLDAPGQPFEDTHADEEFVAGLRETVPDSIPVKVFPENINDETFALACAEEMLTLLDAETSVTEANRQSTSRGLDDRSSGARITTETGGRT